MQTTLARYEPYFLSVLRIVAGFLFLPHGAQKLFGWFGGMGGTGATAEIGSLMWFAGVIEFFGGLLIMVGLLTRPVALVASGQMAAAYFLRHAGLGFWPLLNRGELAALYCFLFLYFVFAGPGPWSLDRLIGRGRRRAPE